MLKSSLYVSSFNFRSFPSIFLYFDTTTDVGWETWSTPTVVPHFLPYKQIIRSTGKVPLGDSYPSILEESRRFLPGCHFQFRSFR